LFPILQFFDEIVVAFRDFSDFAVHTGLEMDVILPCFTDFSCKCILFPDHFVEVSHADFGHDGLFLVALEDCGYTGVATDLLTNVIDNVQDRVLIPPFGILNTFDLSAHHLQSEWTKKVDTMIGPEGWSLPSGYASRRKRGGPVNATVAALAPPRALVSLVMNLVRCPGVKKVGGLVVMT
jgi:hypothetical protein